MPRYLVYALIKCIVMLTICVGQYAIYVCMHVCIDISARNIMLYLIYDYDSFTKPKPSNKQQSFINFHIWDIRTTIKTTHTHTHTHAHNTLSHTHILIHIRNYNEQLALAMAGPLERLKIPRNLHYLKIYQFFPTVCLWWLINYTMKYVLYIPILFVFLFLEPW